MSRTQSIAAVVAVMVGQCFAATVTSEAGDNSTLGSLGAIVDNSTGGIE